jgi:hypothetical protein
VGGGSLCGAWCGACLLRAQGGARVGGGGRREEGVGAIAPPDGGPLVVLVDVAVALFGDPWAWEQGPTVNGPDALVGCAALSMGERGTSSILPVVYQAVVQRRH